MTNLYYSKKLNQYFYSGSENCFICGNPIGSIIIVKRGFSRILSYERFYCVKCQNEAKKSRKLDVEELTSALVGEAIPDDAIPIFFKPPGLQPSKSISSFEAAALPCEKTIDRTRYSGESIGGALIGREPEALQLEKKDEDILKEDVGISLLSDLKEAKPIDFNTKKLLSNVPKQATRKETGASSILSTKPPNE